MIKVELLLAVAEAGAAGAAVATALGSGPRVTVHDASLLSGLAHGDATESAPPFGCLVELVGSSQEAAARQVESAATRLADIATIDRRGSTVIAGSEYTVVAGDEPIMLGMALTRRPDMTRDAFSEYWRTRHAELGRSVPGSEGYRQVHLNEPLTEEARKELGFDGPRFDGLAIAYYSSRAAFEAIMANAEVTSALLADERRFIDHANAAMIVGRAPGGHA